MGPHRHSRTSQLQWNLTISIMVTLTTKLHCNKDQITAEMYINMSTFVTVHDVCPASCVTFIQFKWLFLTETFHCTHISARNHTVIIRHNVDFTNNMVIVFQQRENICI